MGFNKLNHDDFFFGTLDKTHVQVFWAAFL
jgi:hypothetical protein